MGFERIYCDGLYIVAQKRPFVPTLGVVGLRAIMMMAADYFRARVAYRISHELPRRYLRMRRVSLT